MVNSNNVNKGNINELQDIYEVVTNNDIKLHTWSAYSRAAVMNTTEVNELIEGIQKNIKGFMWITEKIENDHHSKVVGTKNNSYLDERIAIATYANREKYTVIKCIGFMLMKAHKLSPLNWAFPNMVVVNSFKYFFIFEECVCQKTK